MPFENHISEYDIWLDKHMKQGKRDVPARLLTLLGLLERLRTLPVMDLAAHGADSGTQLIEHNSFVAKALERFAVESPAQEFGRRSNQMNAWIPPFFTWCQEREFTSFSIEARELFITGAQRVVATRLAVINDDKPLLARYNRGTAAAVLTDLLDQAQVKRRAKDVAEYLVGAKLQLRFGQDIVETKNVNTPSLGQLADFRVGSTAFEVTTVERPDRAHIDQLAAILRDTTLEIWLLARLRDCEKWQHVIDAMFKEQANRICVSGIEHFVGQNVSEIGRFESANVQVTLRDLFQIYNSRWLPAAGGGGIRIVDPERDQ